MKRLPNRFAVFFTLLLLPVFYLSALDMGVMLDQDVSVEGIGGESDNFPNGLTYSAALSPWLTVPFGSTSGNFGKFYFSAAVTAENAYNPAKDKREWSFVPELLRTEVMFRTAGALEINAGRIYYSDPLGFIANGLFDGVRVSFDFGNTGIFGAGIWYTGLLYKKTTEITMTNEDMVNFNKKFEYADFADTYFSSRRILAALDWDNPGLTEWLRLKMALIGQIDVTGNESRYHSQYLTAKASIPVNNFIFGIGASLELLEYMPGSSFEDSQTQVKLGMAGELEAAWLLPTPIEDMLTFTARLSSGTVTSSSFAAFVPITTTPEGNILNAKLSGISALHLDYTGRLHKSFAINLAGAYYILSDQNTYQGYPYAYEGYFLGGEFYGRLIWSPVSDAVITFGGGAFLPSLGNAASNSDALWKVTVSVSLMVF